MPRNEPCLGGILAGPTASGKTALAVEVAKQLPIEVVSADSRQVYRDLWIGTARPTASDQAAVPHHLVGFLDLAETWNAARFAEAALECLQEIRARGRIPFVVGGSGFYLQVLREGLFEAPYDDEELRAVRDEIATWSTDAVIRELQRRDPERLAAIHLNDRYRLTRALEICVASGKSVTELTAARQPVARRFVEFRTTLPRAELHARIAARTDDMLQAGWIDEVATLLERCDPALPGLATLGYPRVVAHLRGELDRDALREAVVRDTRRFARHQEVWFRKMQQATLLQVGESANVERVVAALRGAFPAAS